ncbi:MAG: glycosyltransferase [Candidatus Omnitrophica bacterium]|nr:glycosyltransferase [Candidatus Omnitrophota bacterium]
MRILIGHNYYQIPGGEDAVARSEIDMLKSFGHEVIIYERHNDEIARLNPLRKTAHFLSLAYNKNTYRQLRVLLREQRPDIAHFHNIYYMMTPAVYKACHDEGVPVVQSLHNYRMMCSNALLFRDGHVCEDCLEKNIWEGVRHRCFRNSSVMTAMMAFNLDKLWRQGVWVNDVDRYIVAAEFTRGKYVDRGIPVEKISFKPHFIDVNLSRREKDAGYALYLGRLSQEKGVDTLLAAWESLKDIPLKIVGTGPLEAKLKDLAIEKKLTNVEFLGFLKERQCLEILREATTLVIPSVCYENFPRVVVEAFACGVPVVASRLGSLQELIEDGVTGLLFEPGNPQALTAAVRRCFENHLKTMHMGHNARGVFEDKYTMQTNHKKLMEIYEDVIQRAKSTVRK